MAEIKTICFSADEVNEIEFDGKDTRYGHTFLNFSAPKTILGKGFKDADYAEISIEISNSLVNIVAGPVSVEEEGEWVYDQFDVNLNNEDFNFLLEKAGVKTENYLGFIFAYKKATLRLLLYDQLNSGHQTLLRSLTPIVSPIYGSKTFLGHSSQN